MTLLEQLATASGRHVDIFKTTKGSYGVQLTGSYICDDLGDAESHLYVFGTGATIEQATLNYIEQISGKTLGFDDSNAKWRVLAFVITRRENERCEPC